MAKAPRTLARRRRAVPEGGQVRALARPSTSKNDRIVATAARWIYEGRRLDMQGLADELGISRVTLFRRVGSREELIGQALWRLTERMLDIAVARWEAEPARRQPGGADRPGPVAAHRAHAGHRRRPLGGRTARG